MRVPMHWLRSYCDPALTADEVGEALNRAGIELGRIERVGVQTPDTFVVGRVLSAEQHPKADRLRVCTVDDGSGEPRTIVCGAPNVAAGQTVAVARPGSLMPGGERLGEAKLRGVRSAGMILAEDEVGIGPDHSGIMVLEDGPPPGTPLIDHMAIRDEVLDLEVSPNRPDCLGVYGVAREVHALTGAPLADDPTAADAEPRGDDTVEDHASVEIDDPDVCLRFTARAFEDVRVGPSPLWLKARLSAAGQRPISNVVDVTNYVMLATGQPLHAFDLDRVRGARIVVRRARAGERMTTLDGVERALDSDVAVVADAEGPSGIAGIMGGEISEVSAETTRVLMEAATWVGPNILRSSARLALRSEASARFEKQLHPKQAIAAQRLAARLMVELCGARMVPGTLDAYPRPAAPRRLRLRPRRVERLLGQRIERVDMRAILDRLGFSPGAAATAGGDRTAAEASAGAALEVVVPPFRDSDVQREADLVEEVARVYGVDRLPATLPARRRAVGRLPKSARLRRTLEDALRHRGLYETVSYSFTAPETIERLRLPLTAAPRTANPLSEEQSVMRPLLLTGLLDAARHNAAHGYPRVRLFESAHVYGHPTGFRPAPEHSPHGQTPYEERHHIAAVLTEAAPATWRTPPRSADLFAARALAEALAAAARAEISFSPSGHAFLHPRRQAEVHAGERPLGFVGELHPTVAASWDLDAVACLELDADTLAELATEHVPYRPFSSYPAVVQDLAVVVPEAVPAADVETAVRRGGAGLVTRLELFDVYRGEQVGEHRKSLALRVELRSRERTLTDEEVSERRQAIEAELTRIGGRLRA